MTGYVITTEIDGGACLSRSVACVSQNKLPKLSQCVQVFEWRNQLATARFAEMASGVDLQQAPQLSEEQIAEDRAKRSFRGLESFFCFGAVSSLGSFPGPQAACSHDHLFLGCLQGRCL